jgi:Uncharacterised nucleotidyltransferase
MTELLEPRDALREIAMFGIPDVKQTGPFAVADDRWLDLWNGLRNERLGGLAVAALDAGALELPDECREQLIQRHREDMVRCLALEQTLLDLSDEFDDAGVEFMVLKGPALAHTRYPDPSWRPFIDIDLLVRTRDWQKACQVLEARRCVRRLPEPRPGFDVRFGKAAVHTTPDGLEVDLHRTLVVGPYGLWMEPDELFERTEVFRLAGRLLQRLDDTGLFLHACVHAALGQRAPFAQQLRDVRQVLSVGSIDVPTLSDRVSRWRLGPVVRRAFELEALATGMAWPTRLRPVLAWRGGERDRRVLRAYASERRGRGGTALTALRAIPTFRDRLAYAQALAFPDRAFLQHRNGSAGLRGRFARMAVPLHWLSRRRMTG